MDVTNEKLLRIAMEQSAVDVGCRAEDFERERNVVVLSREDPGARRYLELPFSCHLVSYGTNIVAAVGEAYRETVAAYIDRYPAEHCFETPNLHVLNDALEETGQRICFMAEYFLPDLSRLRELPCRCALRLLGPEDFAPLYTEQWSNALCEKRRELDVLGVGAYAGEELVGLAACSRDCDTMWQIGVDVLPGYRRQGIASAVTSRLALEILKRGRVPFYCAAWSNVKSVRNAIRSGFRPAWVEMTAKERAVVDRMNAVRAVRYRALEEREIDRELFGTFIRRQEVTACRRWGNGAWVIRDDPFVDDWSETDYEELIAGLRRTARAGGFVYGGFCGGRLKGFVSVEPEVFGGKQGYLDLSNLHVSQDMRRKGMGKTLFLAAKAWAAAHGGKKLYISAHSAVESQAFYAAMGCRDAEEPHPGHVKKEPYDCQMECAL